MGWKYSCGRLGLQKKPVESESVAFGLVPRINAAGRLGDPKTAFELLCGEGSREALREYAAELCALNARRQGMQENMVAQAIQMAGAYSDDRILVLHNADWDTGIVGLAASALAERFSKPAILFGERDGFYVGSARSIEGVNIYQAIRASEGLLIVFGGHEAAAGMTIRKENLPLLREQLNCFMFQNYIEEDFYPQAFYDMESRLSQLHSGVITELARLKPFGCKNESVRILLRDVQVTAKQAVGGGRHSKLSLMQEGAVMNGVAFGKTCEEIPERMDALVYVQISDYTGAAEAVVELMSYES